jgi:hypothetical protein
MATSTLNFKTHGVQREHAGKSFRDIFEREKHALAA